MSCAFLVALLGVRAWGAEPAVHSSSQSAKPAHKKQPSPAKAPRAARPKRPPPELVVSTTPIRVVFPPAGYRMDPVRGQFVFGSVSHPLRPFRVNGSTMAVHRRGGFLAYLPVSPGTMTVLCELELPGGATSLTRTFFVRVPGSAPPGNSPVVLPDSVLPAEDLELRPGDWVEARMRATPGQQASFTVAGSKRENAMAEIAPGLYAGAYQVQPADSFSEAEITVQAGRARQAAKGRLTVTDAAPWTAIVRGVNANVRSGPERGFILFPPAGTRLLVTGRERGHARVRLSDSLSGWIEEKSLERLPAGTPPPAATVGTIRVQAGPDSTSLFIDVSEPVPFSVEESLALDQLTLKIYSAAGHTNWVIYDGADRFLDQVRWEQRGSGVVEVTARLSPGARLWGYDASWHDRVLKLELRRPPLLAPRPDSAFKGRVIAVDPGHGPSSPGAIGPLATTETDANWWIAKDLEALLLKEGARPFFTRAGQAEDAGLIERYRLAWSRRAELFVSVHNNALPDGENPFEKPHGFSVFYYHPHSQPLARAVYQAYERGVALPGEGLRYGNLFVARATQMPSILTESTYLMFPEQEDVLLTPARRRALAAAMLEGMRRFLEDERARQQPPGTAGSGKGRPDPAPAPARAPAPHPQKRRKQ